MSVLGLADLLRRKESTPNEDPRFDTDGTFEHEIEAALELTVDEELQQEPASAEGADNFEEVAATDDYYPPADVLTPHAQSLLATFSVFEEANNATREELARIGKAFTSIVTNYNLGREFIDSSRQEIIRASELEQTNNRLTIENRRLQERVEKHERTRERMDDMLEAAKRRETKMVQDSDQLRVNASDLRLELIEARNANVAAEHARTEMHMSLASKTADVERLTREIEVLREKMAGVSAELDASQKRQSEVRGKLEELHVMYTAEVNRFAELNGRASAADKEILRLQKQADAAEAQLKETSLSLQNAEHEIWERDRRHQSELQSLRTETEQLSTRLRRFANADVVTQAEDETVPVIPLRAKRRLTVDKAPATAAE